MAGVLAGVLCVSVVPLFAMTDAVAQTRFTVPQGARGMENAKQAAQIRLLETWAGLMKSAITVTEDGYVGIGTEIPANRLEIWGIGGVDDDFDIRSFGNPQLNQAAAIKMRRYGGTPENPLAIADGARLGGVSFYGYTGTTSRKAAAIYADAAENFASTGHADMRFESFYNGTFAEKMRMTAAGNVGIGTQTPQARLDVKGGFIRATPECRVVQADAYGTLGAAQASCAADEYMMSGGGWCGDWYSYLHMNAPNDTNTGWLADCVGMKVTGFSEGDGYAFARAVCCKR